MMANETKMAEQLEELEDRISRRTKIRYANKLAELLEELATSRGTSTPVADRFKGWAEYLRAVAHVEAIRELADAFLADAAARIADIPVAPEPGTA